MEVIIRPEDRIANRDPQLDKAIEWLMNKIKTEPKELPSTPAWPVKTIGK